MQVVPDPRLAEARLMPKRAEISANKSPYPD
jgi:hypothetical protein